jgi:hypothetical protein
MTDPELDLAYTAVCNALAEGGPQKAERLLAMLSLALMVRFDDAGEVMAVIESVRRRALEE